MSIRSPPAPLTASHSLAAPRLRTSACMHACMSEHKMCVVLLANLELLHVDARVAKLAMFCLHSSQSTVNGNADMWLFA